MLYKGLTSVPKGVGCALHCDGADHRKNETNTMSKQETYKPKIHVTARGGLYVDPEELLKSPHIQKRIKEVKKRLPKRRLKTTPPGTGAPPVAT